MMNKICRERDLTHQRLPDVTPEWRGAQMSICFPGRENAQAGF
jgi:hypothetical protein